MGTFFRKGRYVLQAIQTRSIINCRIRPVLGQEAAEQVCNIGKGCKPVPLSPAPIWRNNYSNNNVLRLNNYDFGFRAEKKQW